MFNIKQVYQPAFYEAMSLLFMIMAIISTMIIFVGTVPHIPVIVSIFVLILFGLMKRVPYTSLEKGLVDGAKSGISAVFIFFMIGLLISAWLLSGTILSLMDTAFFFVSPGFFYGAVFLTASLIGLFIGSSLTTVATIGVALVGVASAMDASAAITAGAVVSGAFFGDKMSPLSDTTNLAASIAGVDLFVHIQNMAWTTVPAFLLSLAGFAALSPDLDGSSFQDVQQIRDTIQEMGFIHWYSWLPALMLVILSIRRVPPLLTLAASTAFATGLSFFHSGKSIADTAAVLFAGFVPDTGNAEVDALLSRGGLDSMMFTVSLILLSLSLGGLLFTLGVIPCLFEGIERKLTTAGHSIAATAATAMGINVIIGEQYLSILLTGEAFSHHFEKLGLVKKNLSRTLEDAGTVVNPLVPWSVCGVFIADVLGVPVTDYFFFAFFCLVSPLLTVLYGYTGWTISKENRS
ncbi:Na+/H+ antiporter NhaC [Domibacillus mangrovi]|uniref:Na+/H+ antiporter NhaC n=1 Tax=Domibacillus mangrovi TaxID=1714354 RepID=A0A1Q5P4Y0_9BACI|nr:Na+/H+ antiporter NhaC [Domibacillus mangrovi]OKL37294.1 Na+/H+ antiporter NhaC [Domibacillus mangrovi]